LVNISNSKKLFFSNLEYLLNQNQPILFPICGMKEMPKNFSHFCHFLLFSLLITMVFYPLTAKGELSLNDPFLSQQWGWFRIAANKAYDAGIKGSGIVVAVLDTGIDLDHPDLAKNIVDGWNFVDNNGDVSDLDNHGTIVSGIIAALANNSEGITGVAPETKIMPLKVLDSEEGNLRDVASAIRYAADNGAHIITMSFGGQRTRFSIITEKAIDYAHSQGCVLVAAVGNDNTSELFYPAAYEQAIAVSAIDQNDIRAGFSNYGTYLDFCAPGVNVVSTGRDGNYYMANGTSFSAPFVAGLIALILSDNPQLTAEEVKTNLRTHAEDLGEKGWDQYYGWGLANAHSAIPEDPIPEFPSLTIIPIFATITITIMIFRKSLKTRHAYTLTS
jgi:subtilisin family serine protease